ncbi:transcription termination factor Rho [Bifidobacterium breve]|uniref:transcription termination factor Rho n=1 Tax=Bifidobacterium breve TaxID=1685 RepID=UPI0006CB3FE6|nr:transcription termination factor Rho [Bifidobacterium breve]ALE14018.1 Transcription termination factor Rho [Bifidobacterium breve]AQM42377.1 transcription termination factor Rho [Bifidobacterium breve]MBK5036338.1 transcription termination factor Rho [Bifidobacterium breve]MBK5055010.1 transcription termination factor Rho [Bifidobacterium breve]MDX5146644.1 transcription termination factor Rho [Bifidobacterium breve]
MANSQNLEDMKLPELKELAKQMGLRGTSTMRKPELLATLQAARSGGEPPAGVTVRTPKADKAVTKAAKAEPVVEETAALAEPQLDLSALAEEPKAAEPRRVRRKAADEATEEPRDARHRRDDERTGRKPRKQADEAGDLLASLDLGETTAPERRRNRRDDTEAPLIRRVHDEDQPRRRRRPADSSDETVRDLDDILATLPTQKHDEPSDDGEQSEDREFSRRSRNRDRDRDNRNDRNDRRNRRMRGRDRGENAGEDDRRFDDRENRNDRREEPQEDLVPVAGIVDVLDSYAFVRTSGYLPGPNDVYVSMGQVKKYGLRKGDAVHGSIRAPRENDRRNQRQKFVPLQSIDSINGQSVEDALNRPQFSKLTPLYPQERLKQETAPNKLTGRIMDIVSPIGKGQRGLIVSPPKAGKTITLQNIANAIAANNPEVHLMVVLVDERPEEVTDMERTVQGEVISSTFDRPASDHTTVAELAIERAKRLVELGQDVVVLLDSMTRLARAYNIAAPASGRILSGGVDAQALYPPKKFFGAARNIENGGSLTIISSALVETGSKMDEVIFEEFKGTGNMELRLSRELADKRLFPAIDINASGTRREELITDPQELPIIYRLRRLLGGMEPEQAYQTLVPRLKKTATNRDFLAAIVQQANTGNAVNGN